MDKILEYSISYPFLEHPLANEKEQVKLKYTALLRSFADQFGDNKDINAMRAERYISDFLNDGQPNTGELKSAINEIMKTRFTPFRFFSYRYLFLFDCIYLYAPMSMAEAQKICEEIKSTVNARYHKRLDGIVKMMFEDNADLMQRTMITAEQFKAWEQLRRYIRTHEKNIIFTATMSAGKSTLINALIGQEVSNTKKAACTSQALCFHAAAVPHPAFHVLSKSRAEINVSAEAVRRILSNDHDRCTGSGYFNSELGGMRYNLIDTQGIDSALNPEHKKITRNTLCAQEYDAVVYVIPVENYGSEGDFFHLKYILNQVKFKKIVFAINMMDTCDFEDDSVCEIMDNVKSHLMEIGYEDPIVCPISAKAGLRFKQALSGQQMSAADEAQTKAFCNKFLNEEYNMGAYYEFPAEPSLSRISDYHSEIPVEALHKAYEHTGLPQFESLLKRITED